MSIYTRTGDNGHTSIIGNNRIPKYDPIVCAIGDIDEVNAAVGVLRTFSHSEKAENILKKIQNDLLCIGSELADLFKKSGAVKIAEDDIKNLEKYIDDAEKLLPPLKHFIIPTGIPFAAHAHLARTICRRAERNLFALNEKELISKFILMYINRLSDLLFMLARGTPSPSTW